MQVSSGISNPHVEGWKREGGRVIGYTCSYFPEELVHALGMLPFRIRGAGCSGTHLADAWYGPVNCSYTRCCLQLVLEGRYGFLDGAVISRTCDHMRRMYDCWKAAGNLPPFFYYFGIPHTLTEHGLEFYREEISSLLGAMERHFGTKLEGERLEEAVREYNRGRRLLLELNEKR
ncbi:MAG: 2-hydroxyacyl-CoA dehydratase family protein, partial [Candidatus Hadarchaeales archaeon]